MAKAVVSPRKLSVHKEHEVLLKLETAGLGEDEAQAIVGSKNNALAITLVEVVRVAQSDKGFIQKIKELLVSNALAETTPVGPRVWAIWLTVKNDKTLTTAEHFNSDLASVGNKVGNWASNILSRADLLEGIDEDEFELVETSANDLGLSDGGTTKEIHDAAFAQGLHLCPARVGPLLRKQYQNQPSGEYRVIAMKAIADSDGDLYVFFVERGGDDFWLYTFHGHPDRRWYADARWVFVRRKVS